MEAREEVACRFCGESILSVAAKCKHCGEWSRTNHRASRPWGSHFRVALKAAGLTALAVVLLASPAWRRSIREEGLFVTVLIVLGLSAYVGIVVFSARVAGVYRTREEWDLLKAQGQYSSADESRRAIYVFLFGVFWLVASVVAVGAIAGFLLP